MVDIALPSEYNERFLALIPSQRMRVNALMNDGVLIGYSLSEDRTRLWAIVTGESERDVLEVVETFPLISYMRVSIHPLMFHNQGAGFRRVLSLN
ncbi:MAG: hypothetical protein IPP94_14440 [Ignavibacteria bacterium]|nr:hypothetical protein [Ignavibacteria bacterium]